MDERKRKRHRIFKRIGRIFRMILVLAIAAGITASLMYVGIAYHADETAQAYLDGPGQQEENASSVKILDIEQGLFLDGAGTENALVFYPGAKVEYTAYLPFLYRLAEDGIDCFLVKMPANLAVFGKNKAERIIRYNPYEHWYIGGHSLGGVMAADYAARHEEELDGVVLLASYPAKKLSGDLKVLQIYGSEDSVLDGEKLQEAKQYLPPNAVTEEIKGGNHSQFGNYGLQAGDGQAEISAQEQQTITAAKTEELILAGS